MAMPQHSVYPQLLLRRTYMARLLWAELLLPAVRQLLPRRACQTRLLWAQLLLAAPLRKEEARLPLQSVGSHPRHRARCHPEHSPLCSGAKEWMTHGAMSGQRLQKSCRGIGLDRRSICRRLSWGRLRRQSLMVIRIGAVTLQVRNSQIGLSLQCLGVCRTRPLRPPFRSSGVAPTLLQRPSTVPKSSGVAHAPRRPSDLKILEVSVRA